MELESNAKDEGSGSSAASGEEVRTVSQEEHQKLLDKVEELSASKERILDESKSHASKYRTLRDEMDDQTKTTLQSQGKFEDLYKKAVGDLDELRTELVSERKYNLRQKLELEVARLAPDAHNVDDIINSLPMELITINEAEKKFEGIDKAEAWVRENKKYFYKTHEAPRMTSDVPGGQMGTTQTYAEELKRCSTQKQLEAVMLKHGRLQ